MKFKRSNQIANHAFENVQYYWLWGILAAFAIAIIFDSDFRLTLLGLILLGSMVATFVLLTVGLLVLMYELFEAMLALHKRRLNSKPHPHDGRDPLLATWKTKGES